MSNKKKKPELPTDVILRTMFIYPEKERESFSQSKKYYEGLRKSVAKVQGGRR